MAHPDYKANWHTHTYRCKHARGDVCDYCRYAVEAGLEKLGFADHMPTPDGRWCNVRMTLAELAGYRKAVDDAKIEFPSLELHCGLECEWYPDFGESYYRDVLAGNGGIEYMAGAPHSFRLTPTDWRDPWSRVSESEQPVYARAYGRHVVEMIGTGIFAFIAHPDLFGNFCDHWSADLTAISHDIAQAARATGIPLEINTYGIRKPWVTDNDGIKRPAYPWNRFWEIVAEEGATAIINTDAHDPEVVAATVDEAFAIAESVGLNVDTSFSPV